MARLLVVVLVLATFAHAQKNTQFCTKLTKQILPFFTPKECVKVADPVGKDLANQKTMQQISDSFMGSLLTAVPIMKVPKLLGIKNAMDKCLKDGKTGDDTFSLLEKVATVLMKKLQAPYNKIIKKMKAMTKNNKPLANKVNQAFNIAIASCNKKFIQTCVTACANQLDCTLWQCAVKEGSGLLSLSNYDTKRKNGKKC